MCVASHHPSLPLLRCDKVLLFVHVVIVIVSYIPESFVSFINVYKVHYHIHVKEYDIANPALTAEDLKVLPTQYLVRVASNS